MGIIREHIDYLKNNPEGYWFKRRLYGWGWIPARWQGWAVLFGYILLLVLLAFNLEETPTENQVVFGFILPVLLMTLILIGICYKKGEKPKWMWGPPKDSK